MMLPDLNESEMVPLTKKYRFKCQRCGRCCRLDHTHLKFLWREKKKMDLFFSPAYFFDGTLLAPIGCLLKTPEGSRCPYTNGTKCGMYKERPMTCKVYPLSYNEQGDTLIDQNCPGVTKVGLFPKKEDERRSEPFWNDDGTVGKMLQIIRRWQRFIHVDIAEYFKSIVEKMESEDLIHTTSPGVMLLYNEVRSKEKISIPDFCKQGGVEPPEDFLNHQQLKQLWTQVFAGFGFGVVCPGCQKQRRFSDGFEVDSYQCDCGKTVTISL